MWAVTTLTTGLNGSCGDWRRLNSTVRAGGRPCAAAVRTMPANAARTRNGAPLFIECLLSKCGWPDAGANANPSHVSLHCDRHAETLLGAVNAARARTHPSAVPSRGRCVLADESCFPQLRCHVHPQRC